MKNFSEKKNLSKRYRTIRALTVSLAGFVVATSLAMFAYHQVNSRERAYRNSTIDSVYHDFQSQIRLIEGYVYALSGYYTAEREISPSEFAEFAKKLNPIGSVKALQFIRAVEAQSLDEYINQQRLVYGLKYQIRDKTEDAELKPAAARSLYFPVEMSYPIVGNEASLGLDITSNPSAYATLLRSQSTGSITTTGSFPLVQDVGARAFSLYGAVSHPGEETLAGGASALVDLKILVSNVAGGHASIAKIIDTASNQPIYQVDQPASYSRSDVRQVMVGDSNWTLHIGISSASSPMAAGFLVFGVVALLTLLALGALDFAALQAAHVIVGKRLNESELWLEQKEAAYSALFHNTATANVELDPDAGTVLRSNAAFDLMIGESDHEEDHLDMMSLVAPSFRTEFSHAFEDVVDGKEQSSQLEFCLVNKEGDLVWVLASIGGSENATSGARRISMVMQDIRERKEIEATRDLLVRELAHRLRNTMQLVASLAEQSARSSATVSEYRDRLRGRLYALSMAQDALFETNWTPVRLNVLAKSILEPFEAGHGRRRIQQKVASVTLEAQQAQTIALALHELANNAARFGALSIPDGQVELHIDLSVGDGGRDSFLELRWKETSSLVKFDKPKNTGFGSVMLEKLLTRQYGGEARFEWLSDQLLFTARLPLSNIPEEMQGS